MQWAMDYGRAPLLASAHPQARHADERRRRTWFRRAAVISFVLVLVYGHYRTMHALASLGAEVVSDGVARRGTDPSVEPTADDSRANELRERVTFEKPATTVHTEDPVVHTEDPCEDVSPDCQDWVDSGECETNPNYMLLNCRKSCGACETVQSGEAGGFGGRAPQTILAERAPSESSFVTLNSGARMPRVGFGTAAPRRRHGGRRAVGARGWLSLHRQRAGARVVPRRSRRPRHRPERRLARDTLPDVQAASSTPRARDDD